MSRFLDTRGKSNLAIGYCQRCQQKMANADMVEDGDRPGLFVCPGCRDSIDPWKLPPRSPEDVTVPHPTTDGFVGSAGGAIVPDQGKYNGIKGR